MKRMSKGFTLVEILVAVAILGILSSIAIPQYTVYVKRAKITEAVQFTQEISLAMTMNYLDNGVFFKRTGAYAGNAEIGYGGPDDYNSEVINKWWVAGRGVIGADSTSGHIVVVLAPDLAAGNGGNAYARLISTIEFKNGAFEFVCGNTNSAVWPSEVDPIYLPKSCQN